ncbi:hypothetical protein C0Q70_20465 [Pomacea canaliculata]|uniref:non-specific serine/threonine protein kinase n=1 Tax=Pomacea canaliculata TaxID=400727 RepID=A0A2T7NFM7_POMCA|nr:hypothetical protein C0Q70_20465 [Pomacea canaliculata]
MASAQQTTSVVPNLANYILTEKLGSGSYATVYKAYKKTGIREVVAIKCVLKSSLNKASTENLLTEIELLKNLKHEHIVELKDFIWDSKYIYLVMEYCSGGDLSHFIKSKRALPERIVRKFLQQIDFGFAKPMLEGDQMDVMRGSPLYMAPEIICRKSYDARVDLWSIGVILYECLFGRAPFASRSFKELGEKIWDSKPVELPPGVEVSDDCRDLLLKLLQRNPEDRISFEEFFNHPFVDLLHAPSPYCLRNAKDIVSQAVKKDTEGDYKNAVTLYCNALAFFVPAIHYEKDPVKKEALRAKVREYMMRAETLKQLLKPHKSSESVNTLERTISSDGDEKLGEPKGPRRDLIVQQVKLWMSKAEEIKAYLAIRELKTEDTSKQEEEEDESQTGIMNLCRLQ